MKYVEIGGIKLEKTAVLAPMASVADRAFRLISREFGAAAVTGEMASAKALVFNDRKTHYLLNVTDDERPMAVQIFGDDPEYIGFAARQAERYAPDFIDINAGCPVPKVAVNGSGSALMKNPRLFGEIVASAVAATKIPVTVKIRKGWNLENVNAVEIAKIAEKAGAAAIAVHGRTREQMYTGKADWSIIKAVKQAVKIPVIGNGDVNSVQSCEEMYTETGCDLVMIGRAACGNPWLFRDIRAYFSGEEIPPPPTIDERLAVLHRHVKLIVSEKGELSGMREARKQGWYIKGLKNAAKFRNDFCSLTYFGDFEEMLKQIKQENEES